MARDALWDGLTRADLLNDWARTARLALAEAVSAHHWSSVFECLAQHGEYINCCRPGGTSWFAPLHHAADAGAPVAVVERLIAMGAWRTLRTARGERAVEVAERSGQYHLREVLEPVLRHQVPPEVLSRIQAHFHAVIRGRIDEPLPGLGLRLPELEPLLELEQPEAWFPVPGMYGGFHYRLEGAGAAAMLISESVCRVVWGSEQRHEITAEGSRCID